MNPTKNQGENSGALEGSAVPAQLVTPILLLLLQTQWYVMKKLYLFLLLMIKFSLNRVRHDLTKIKINHGFIWNI